MKQSVIYIDDDAINLELFKLQFEEYYDVMICNDPTKALDVIVSNSIPFIISDYRMPDINGMELITQVKKIAPRSICVLLSGFSSQSVFTDETLLFDFISKPYDVNVVMSTIRKGFHYYDNLGCAKAS